MPDWGAGSDPEGVNLRLGCGMRTRTEGAAGPPMPGMGAAAAWAEVREVLQARRRAVFARIAAYPAPIAGCDQQFNHLLTQRDGLTAALNRLEALCRGGDPGAGALAAFLADSAAAHPDAFDAETRAALGALPAA